VFIASKEDDDNADQERCVGAAERLQLKVESSRLQLQLIECNACDDEDLKTDGIYTMLCG
jgi:hypothetical protein